MRPRALAPPAWRNRPDLATLQAPMCVSYRLPIYAVRWRSPLAVIVLLRPMSVTIRRPSQSACRPWSTRARAMEWTPNACKNPRAAVAPLRAFDDELKARGVKPGTSADLPVAVVAVTLLQAPLI